jgi:hypothetical protein
VRRLGRDQILDAAATAVDFLGRSLQTERRRFVWVIALWAIAVLLIGPVIATIIGLVALLAYWRYFLDFLREAFKNEWPYNFLGALGAVMLYFLVTLGSVFSNFTISSITGFHPTHFPSAAAVLSAIFMFFSFFFAFTIISGLAALITGFSSGIANRIFPIAFMVSMPIFISLLGWGGHDESIIALTEKIIISTDFNENARFEHGWYSGTDGMKEYGTKVCRNLPFDALLTPHAEGGYITATPRAKPALLVFLDFPRRREVLATTYVYGYVEKKDCPEINEYIEQPSKKGQPPASATTVPP